MTKEDERLINQNSEQLQKQTEANFGVSGREISELEKKLEQGEGGAGAGTKSAEQAANILKRRRPQPVAPARDDLTVKVEKILEEGVADAYSRLSPIAKQEFKIKGEETARKITLLLRATHVKAKKIFQLILEWLRLLPGINRFFLEQEAKIKADRIIHLNQK